MRSCIVALSILCATPALAGEGKGKSVPPVLQFKMQSLDGNPVDLAKYQGKVILVINVASECGYTPQYKGLQALHEKYGKDGLVVLGVPSNDYGGQEPGTNKQIADFCKQNYGVTFDMLAKVGVADGANQCALYKFLTSKKTNPTHGGPVRWNFEKFLIGRDGSIVARFEADAEPESDAFQKAIRDELTKKR